MGLQQRRRWLPHLDALLVSSVSDLFRPMRRVWRRWSLGSRNLYLRGGHILHCLHASLASQAKRNRFCTIVQHSRKMTPRQQQGHVKRLIGIKAPFENIPQHRHDLLAFHTSEDRGIGITRGTSSIIHGSPSSVARILRPLAERTL